MRRSYKQLIYLSVAVGLLLPTYLLGQSKGDLPKIGYTEFKLKNGLTVVMHPDKSTPVVAVNVFYHVGSKNESPGRTGFAHLFEHMMFQGSKNYVSDYLNAVDDMGGDVNGTTDEDRTWYYEVVPANYLERTLYLEADRMGNLLDAMTQAKLDNQRDVVKNERRLRVDNVPYGTMPEKIGEIMYPAGHPYNWSVIGSMADLGAASLDDVKSFFRTYYVPNNATLVLSGDYDEGQAKAWIEKYFGPIAGGAEVRRPNVPQPRLSGEIRKTVEDAVPFPRLSLIWHSVPQYSDDEAALDTLASILSNGRGSRLQTNLNFGKELVSQIFSWNQTSEIGGLFQISAFARPGKTLEEIEKEINLEIERIKKVAPTADEMERSLNGRESQFINGLGSVLGKGAQLSNYAGYLKKPDYFQADLDRYRKVTASDVQRVANQYLNSNRLVMAYVPGAPAAQPNATSDKPASSAETTAAPDKDLIERQKAMLPKAGPTIKFALPSIEKTKLNNGLNVWFVKQNELPIVSMNLVVNAGSTQDSAEKFGVAAWTGSMLNQGTSTRTAVDIANQLQSLGASINAGSSWDSTNISLQSLTKNLDQTLEIYGDVIQNPAFPESEVESLRRRSIIGLAQRKSQPSAVVGLAFNKILYGDQAYGRDTSESSLKAITRGDLVNFHKANFVPNNATLIVVGDVDSKATLAKLEKTFASWKPGNAVVSSSLLQTMKGKPGIYIIDKPGAAQSTIAAGVVGIDRSSPDYYAVQMLNAILGGNSGRLFKKLREEKGYTYGAFSSFTARKGAGPFRAGGDFQTGSTKESVVDLMKEIDGLRGGIPATQAELDTNRMSLINGYPQGFETVSQISGQLSNLVIYGLPDSYFNDYIQKISKVTLQDVNRVANKYLDPTRMAIVVVGDRKVVESKLRELNYPVTILDSEGNPVAGGQ